MVGHEIEQGIGLKQGERPVEKPPSRVYQADQEKDQMPLFHRAFLRPFSAVSEGLFRAFPQG